MLAGREVASSLSWSTVGSGEWWLRHAALPLLNQRNFRPLVEQAVQRPCRNHHAVRHRLADNSGRIGLNRRWSGGACSTRGDEVDSLAAWGGDQPIGDAGLGEGGLQILSLIHI
jgi:hypothetical protein